MKLRKPDQNPQIKVKVGDQTFSVSKQEVQALVESAVVADPSPLRNQSSEFTKKQSPSIDFAWKASPNPGFTGRRFADPRTSWGNADAQATTQMRSAPYSLEEKTEQLEQLRQLRVGDYRPYTIRESDVPETFRMLSDLEELRMLDPSTFAEKLKDPQTKQAYGAYAQALTRPLINGEFGSGDQKKTSAARSIYWVVPEQNTVYVRGYDLTYKDGKLPESVRGRAWTALPFEPELLTKPSVAEIRQEIEQAKDAVEKMVSISQITRSARTVFQHLGDRSIWNREDQDAPDLVQLRKSLASYLTAFAERTDQLFDRAETDQMKRDVGGAAGALASLRKFAWKETPYTAESALFELRTRVVRSLEAAA